jgi:hypothetical protein
LDYSGLVAEAANNGLLSEAHFVIFARNRKLDTEDDLANNYTYFHGVWLLFENQGMVSPAFFGQHEQNGH